MPEWDENGRPIKAEAPQEWDENGRPVRPARQRTDPTAALRSMQANQQRFDALPRRPAPRTKPTRGQARRPEQEATGFLATLGSGIPLMDEAQALFGMMGNAVQGDGAAFDADAAIQSFLQTGNPGMAIGRGNAPAYRQALGEQRGYENDFQTRRPVVANATRSTGSAGSAIVPVGSGAQVAAQGGRWLNAARGATTAAAEGAIFGLTDRGDAGERLDAGALNALLSAPFGAAIGSLARGNRPGPPKPAPRQKPGSSAQTNTRGIRRATRTTNAEAMRAEAQRLRDLGLDPTLVDVTDEAGRGVIRDAASRQTPARTVVQQRYDAMRTNVPRQAAQRVARLTPDEPRPAVDVLAETRAQRGAQARQDYARAGPGRVQIDPVGPELSYQRQAVTNAANTLRTNKMYDAAAELDEVLARLDNGLPVQGEVSVAALDQVKRELLTEAENAAKAIGARTNRGPGLTERGANIDDYLARQSPDYATARDNYARSSQRMEGLDQGNILRMTGPQGAAQIRNMPAPQQEGARVAVRQELQDMFTSNTQAQTPLRKLELEQDLNTILTELYGPEAADELARYAGAQRQQLNRMGFVSPNEGSQTFGRQQDAASGLVDALDEGLGATANAMTGNKFGLAQRFLRWSQDNGLSNADAQLLAEAAVDPARLDDIIAGLERRSPELAASLRQMIAADPALASRQAGAAVATTTSPRPGPPAR